MVATALMKALSAGGEILWDTPNQPRIRAPKNKIQPIKSDTKGVREILRRAVEFRKQIKTSGPFPFFILPEGKEQDGGCLSCGTNVSKDKLRCPYCQAAAWIALDVTPSPESLKILDA
jgi:hypothetical protein